MASAAGPVAVCEGCTISDRLRSCRAAAPCGGSCASGLTNTGAIGTPDRGAIAKTTPAPETALVAETASVAKASPLTEAVSVAKASPLTEAVSVAKATTLPGAEVSLLHAAAELVACSGAIRTVPLEAVL